MIKKIFEKTKFSQIIAKVRIILERNKIFFETITATALTAMSIFLIYNSNKLTEQQININKLQSQPVLEINTDTSGVVITNSGTRGNNWRVEPALFLSLVCLFDQEVTKKITIPIYQHFEEIPNFFNHPRQVAKYEELYPRIDKTLFTTKFSNYAKKQNPKFQKAVFDIAVFFKITYLDIFNEEHIIFMQYDLYINHPVLDKEVGEDLFEEYNNKSEINFVDLPKDETIKKLWQILLNNSVTQ